MSDRKVLECRGLEKTFRDTSQAVEVLKGIDLTLSTGEQLAVIGASGSGKSTLLHLLGGLDRPTAGTVLIDGEDVNRLSDTACGRLRNRTLGFVYQFHHLLPEFTALENVAMPLLIRGTALDEANDRALEILNKTGLGARLDHKPAQLSGGERQRAAIARALVTRPDCILADEPTGNLDHRNAMQVYDVLLELNQSLSIAMIVVTHDHELAGRMQRRYQLEDGYLRGFKPGK